METALYRIEDIEKITYNGRLVKTFKAFERQPSAIGGYSYVYLGTFKAPAACPNRDLTMYIDDDPNFYSGKNPAAVALGRLGGLAKSPVKSKSSAANGKKGGRPKLAK